MSKHTHSITLDLGCFGEQEVDVTYYYSEGRPAVMYLSNGDPGYPEEPAELEIMFVELAGIKLPDNLWNTEYCAEVIVDQLSTYHSEDY